MSTTSVLELFLPANPNVSGALVTSGIKQILADQHHNANSVTIFKRKQMTANSPRLITIEKIIFSLCCNVVYLISLCFFTLLGIYNSYLEHRMHAESLGMVHSGPVPSSANQRLYWPLGFFIAKPGGRLSLSPIEHILLRAHSSSLQQRSFHFGLTLSRAFILRDDPRLLNHPIQFFTSSLTLLCQHAQANGLLPVSLYPYWIFLTKFAKRFITSTGKKKILKKIYCHFDS